MIRPAGVVDGANLIFTLTGVPNPPSSLAIYRNGVLQKLAQDFQLAGSQLTFIGTAPQPRDTLLASYRLAGGADTAPQLYPNPQVLCSGLGGAVSTSTLSSIGACTIPAGFLAAGDRVEIHFDLEHQGALGGFTFELHWGATTVLSRNGSPVDALLSGRAAAALTSQGAQISHQSWGTSLPFTAGIGTASDDYNAGLTVDFQAKVAQAGEIVTLKNFTVVRSALTVRSPAIRAAGERGSVLYSGKRSGDFRCCQPSPLSAFRNATRSALSFSFKCRAFIFGSKFLFAIPPLL